MESNLHFSKVSEHLDQIPSPCYVMEESLLRRNLELIRSVKERAGEIILAFKSFAMWKSFSYISGIHPIYDGKFSV